MKRELTGKIQIVFGILFLLTSVIAPFKIAAYYEKIEMELYSAIGQIINAQNISDAGFNQFAYITQVHYSFISTMTIMIAICVVLAAVSIILILQGLANHSKR